MKERKLKIIKKLKKLFYTMATCPQLCKIAIYEWQLNRIAKAYWKEVKKELHWED